jgi:hypothetical protein
MSRSIASALAAALILSPMAMTHAVAGGKYVTYNGSSFRTYPLAPAQVAVPARVVRPAVTLVPATTYVVPTAYRTAPSSVYYVMPTRANSVYVPVMSGGR